MKWTKSDGNYSALVGFWGVVASVVRYTTGKWAAHGGDDAAKRVGPFRDTINQARKDAEEWEEKKS